MMILKMMTASWNLHWQMKIHLYYRGPAWAAEASQMLRNPLGRLRFLVHHCNDSDTVALFYLVSGQIRQPLLLVDITSQLGNLTTFYLDGKIHQTAEEEEVPHDQCGC